MPGHNLCYFPQQRKVGWSVSLSVTHIGAHKALVGMGTTKNSLFKQREDSESDLNLHPIRREPSVLPLVYHAHWVSHGFK